MSKELARNLCPPILWKALSRLRKHSFEPPIPSEDRLSAWMRFVNPGMMAASNRALVAHCIAQLPSENPIVEIGSFAGLSLNTMNVFLRQQRRPNPIFSSDDWFFEGYHPDETIDGVLSFREYREHVIESFRRNVSLFSRDRLPHHIELNSDQFFAAWRTKERRRDFFGRQAELGGPISLAYVDGDHSHAQSLRDFRNVDEFLEPGGFIIFDDSADASEWGSRLTAQYAAALPNYEVIAKNPNYCIRKVGSL